MNTPANLFKSKLAKTIYGGDITYEAAQFHFHAGSEHTIDNKRMDLEMHTVHNPKTKTGGIIAAAMGIMFSVNDFNVKLTKAEQTVIDTFFETLDWSNKASPTVNLLTYGDLMGMVDMNNRWIYKGSVTTPPCAVSVYWNVLQTVYPVKQKHLDLFKAQLAQGDKGKLAEWGNYREI